MQAGAAFPRSVASNPLLSRLSRLRHERVP